MSIKQNKKVSIVIPIFNVEAYLEECLNSLFNQSYKNIEIIMVDDGSIDNSTKICKEFSEKDSRFILIEKENGGVSSARNLGLDYINGDYFMFVDGDDTVALSYVEDMLLTALNYNSDIVSAPVKFVYDNQVRVDIDGKQAAYKADSISAIEKLLYVKGIGSYVMAKIYRSSLLKKERFDTELTIGEDLEYLFRILRSSKTITIFNLKLYFYRQRNDSAMNKAFSPDRADACVASKKILNYSNLNKAEKLAAETKLFSESVTLMAMMGAQKNNYGELYSQALRDALEFKNVVILNNKARLVTRIYALIIAISPNFAIWLAGLKREKIRMNIK